MKKTTLILAIAGALVACGGKNNVSTTAPAANAQAAAATLPAGHPPISTTQAQTQANVANVQPVANDRAPANGTVTGKVLDTMNAGGYTYIQLKTESGNLWAAVPQFPVKKNSTITIAVQMVMENFESKSLNRKFDKLLFATIPQTGSAKPELASMQMPPMGSGNPMTSAMGSAQQHMNPNVDAGSIKVDKAVNGHTVAEVWERKSVMKDQPVTVRGKVVKFLPEIMGKNWLHLRDGSGTRAKGDDDITITTKDAVKVGDVVTVTGTLRVDKDFGAGYMYPVIVEDAKISQ